MAGFLTHFLINFLDLFIYNRYLGRFLYCKKKYTRISVSCIFLFSMLWSMANLLRIGVLNLIVTFLFLLLYLIFFEGTLREKTVLLALFLGIGIVIEPIGYFLFQVMPAHTVEEEQLSYYMLALFLELGRIFAVEVICMLRKSREFSISNLPRKIIYVIIGIEFFSVISCIFIMRIALHVLNIENIVLCTAIIVMIIMNNYFMFYLLEHYEKFVKEKRENEMYLQEMHYKESYYREVEAYNDRICHIRHDFKNQLLALLDTLCPDSTCKMADKIQEVDREIRELEHKIYTEHPAINTILRNKLEMAERGMVQIDIKIQIPNQLNVDLGDLGILFGNLLDNALEACVKVNEKKRFIWLYGTCRNGNLLLILKNSKEVTSNPDFATNKPDKILHGRGIQSVKHVVEKYSGLLNLEDRGEEFEVKAMLYGVANNL